MSFSKAKLKRFNDVDVICGSPATSKYGTPLNSPAVSTSASASSLASTASASSAHCDRKEQIEKFFKDAVRFASNSNKEPKEFAIPKDNQPKEDKKHKGLRLFRTPSLPQRLRFRPHADNNNHKDIKDGNGVSTASSTPLNSATTTPIKSKSESKSASRLKGKDALQEDIRKKNELLESYLSQIDVLQRHVQQLKETEQKLREENTNANMKTEALMQELSNENVAHKEHNEKLSMEKLAMADKIEELQLNLERLGCRHVNEVASLKATTTELQARNAELSAEIEQHLQAKRELCEQLEKKQVDVKEALEKLKDSEQNSQKNYEMLENLKNNNMALIDDVKELKEQIEQDTLNYAQETRTLQMEMDLLRNERNTLKNDLASKCDLIRSLQDELLDKNCEIDVHCDTIRDLCREKAKYAEKERLMETAEQQVRNAEEHVQKLESDLEKAIAQEKKYWQGEIEKRQKIAENEVIKIELEKQDVMVLLETTNDMLRDRDEKIQKYEEQLRNGLDYYIQLTDNLQKQVVDLKQEMAKVITEKYNYQLTLNNTRSTVNILMERLKKSDADVERFKAELESVQLAKGALEDSYLTLQQEMETLRHNLHDSESALRSLRDSSQTLQHEVSVKETILNEMLTSEEETLTKFNKIASSFQERIDTDAARYAELYNELKHKDEKRENYMQDMKKALDEFSAVLQIAQIELDSKENLLFNVREECEKLKLENITLKSKIEENAAKKENSTDMEKIEDLLIDSELRAECDKIATWLLNSSTEKCVRDNANEMNELLKPSTPNNKTRCHTPVRQSAGKVSTNTTPHTPKTPRTPRTTPKKTVLFAATGTGKENLHSPNTVQMQVLKARNM